MADSNDWKADAKAPVVDAAVLPKYTLLPDSPSTGSESAPVQSVGSAGDMENGREAGRESRETTCGSEGGRIKKLLWTGLLAIVIPPIGAAAGVLACVGAVIYGCGKVLEGIGLAIAYVPKVYVADRIKALKHKTRGRGAQDVERGQAIAIVGLVATSTAGHDKYGRVRDDA